MVDSLLSKPTLVGTMQESPQYRTLSIGQTDSILLVGHADAELMYEPYRVTNIRTAVNFLAADTKSPLLIDPVPSTKLSPNATITLLFGG